MFLYNLPVFKQLILLLHYLLVTLNGWLHSLGLGPSWSWGLAIICLTIIVRLVLFPLTWKQFSSAQAMQVVQPKIKELQKRYKNDRAKLQEETMRLYQEHHVNPFASCLPILLQLPVFISLYAAIKGLGPLSAPQYQASVHALARAPFLWIPHLGLPDPYYILLILYVVSQLVSTELMLTPQTDKQQKYIMRAMPIFFVFILFRFPAGLFVYWVTTNLWTIGQQLLIKRVMKPVTAEQIAARPAKTSRFMTAMNRAQEQARTQRQALADGENADGGGKPSGAGKTGATGKSGGKPAGKPGATRPAGAPPRGGQGSAPRKGSTGKSGTSKGGTSKGGAKPSGKPAGGRSAPPPGKGTNKSGPGS
jgi:YidC/Oxa1 family membrane protein insertase